MAIANTIGAHMGAPFRSRDGKPEPFSFVTDEPSKHKRNPCFITAPEPYAIHGEGDFLQTACTLATCGAVDVISKSSADLDTLLLNLNIMVHWSATAAAGLVRARVSADDTQYTIGHIGNHHTVTAHRTLNLNYSPIGLNIGTDPLSVDCTAACYVDLTGCTATVQVIAQFWRAR